MWRTFVNEQKYKKRTSCFFVVFSQIRNFHEEQKYSQSNTFAFKTKSFENETTSTFIMISVVSKIG
jgi:hypothetical protein